MAIPPSYHFLDTRFCPIELKSLLLIKQTHQPNSSPKRTIFFLNFLPVVSQPYEVEADNEYVIRGNSAIMKCEIPSFVADFVIVTMWSDSNGNEYRPNENKYGIYAWKKNTIWCAEWGKKCSRISLMFHADNILFDECDQKVIVLQLSNNFIRRE